MSYRKSSCASASVLVVLALMLTACQQGSPQAAAPTADSTPQGVLPDLNQTAIDSQPSDSGAAQEQTIAQPKTAQSLDNGTAIAANGSASPKPESSANAKQKQSEANPYSPQNPSLMGLSLQMSKDKVTTAYGKPSNQFKMEDETEPLTVLDYDDFSVGFDNSNRLQFVDVTGDKADPGLNGLQIGQKSSQAIEALGKPDTQTNYVLTYKSKTAVLKLDIDPKTTVIRSIKLFPRTDS